MSYGVGLDIGTSFIVGSSYDKKNVVLSKERNAFFELINSKDTLNILKNLNAKFVETDKHIYVVGESALSLANSFGVNARRPMYRGAISSKEEDARIVLLEILGSILAKPKKERETCCFTVPASPLDDQSVDVDYHESLLSDMVYTLGFKPIAINEALCVVYNDLWEKNASGIGISFGAGMMNVCMANIGVATKTFSIAKSGDWVDQKVSERKAGLTASRALKLKESKESPIDLIKDLGSKDVVRDAIARFYHLLIKTSVVNIASQFGPLAGTVDSKVDIIVAGGTSLATGFIDVFRNHINLYAKDVLPWGEIRLSEDPLFAVSKGALLKAKLEENE